MPTYEEYEGLAQSALLVPQAYTTAASRQIAQRTAAHGLNDRVLLQTFAPGDAHTAWHINPDLRILLLGYVGTPPTVATARAAHACVVGPNAADVTPAYIAELHASGLAVVPYTVNRVVDAERLLREGVDGLFSDDPEYLRGMVNSATASGTVVPVPERLPAAGWQSSRPFETGPGLTVEGGFARPTHVGASGGFVFPPLRLPDASWRLSTTLAMLTRSPDTSRYVGLRFAVASDHDAQPFCGLPGNRAYYVLFRADGRLEVGRASGGVATPLVRATWATLQAGDAVPIEVTVTPTTISVRHLVTNALISAIDDTYPRDGFVDAFGDVNVVGLGDLAASY